MFKDILKNPEAFFVVMALLSGASYISLTPPFQVPDEINHFYRAYQVSQGQLTATKTTDRLGGYLPLELAEFSSKWDDMIGRTDQQTSFREINQTASLKLSEELQWYDFPNTAIYSALNYAPQALGISISKLFSSSILHIYYGSRLVSLLLWVLPVFFAIKLLPGKKWVMTAIALLPMSLYINSSLSADLVLNGLSFLFISLIFRYKSQPKHLSPLQLVLLFAFAWWLPLLKLVYAPMLLLIVLIPAQKIGIGKVKYTFYSLLTIAAIASSIWANRSVNNLYIPYAEYSEQAGWVHLAEGSNKDQQLEYVMANPWDFIGVATRSITNGFEMYMRGYIGTFGWLEFGLPMMVVVLTFLFLISISVLDRPMALTKIEKSGIGLVSAMMISLVILSQYAVWGIVGSNVVSNLQGRYFIPIFILLILIAPSFPKPKMASKLSMILIVLVNGISLVMILQRFFSA